MSQIFDVIAEKTGLVTISGSCGQQHFEMTRMCYRGPNQFVVPQFIDPKVEPNYGCTETNYKFSGPIGSRVGSERAHFDIVHHTPEVTALNAQVRQFTELSTQGKRYGGRVVLAPRNLTKINHATYHLILGGKCASQDEIELQFNDGSSLRFNGDLEMHSYNAASLSFFVLLPARAIVRLSYEQIMKLRDSIITKLARMQYGKDPIQP
jgi:hypothetical protein